MGFRMAGPTQAPYDDIANQWDAARADFRPNEAAYLDLLLHGILPGSAVLDLGCGTGRPNAQRVAARGHRVVGVDWSRALLERARRHVPGGAWVEADIVTVEFRPQFAAAICWDSLFHVERAHHRPVVEKIHRCLLPRGRLMLSSGGSASDLPAFTDAMFGHEFFYDAYPTDQMVRLVRDVGFDIVLAELVDPPDGGRNKGKLGVIASKRA